MNLIRSFLIENFAVVFVSGAHISASLFNGTSEKYKNNYNTKVEAYWNVLGAH